MRTNDIISKLYSVNSTIYMWPATEPKEKSVYNNHHLLTMTSIYDCFLLVKHPWGINTASDDIRTVAKRYGCKILQL